MELCSDGHDEVCYETRHCPACLIKDERDEWIKECKKLKADVERLNEME